MSLRFTCPSCEAETSPARLEPRGSQVAATCASCGATFEVAADGKVSAWRDDGRAQVDADALLCPKCETRQPLADACKACGLLREHMDDFQHDGEGDADELWAKVEADWENDDAHEAYLSAAVAGGFLSVAARRYRSRKDEPRSRRYLERIAAMATALMGAAAEVRREQEPEGTPYRAVALLLLFLLVLAVAIGLFVVMKQRAEPGHPAVGPTRASGRAMLGPWTEPSRAQTM